jgi:hypothetical protein
LIYFTVSNDKFVAFCNFVTGGGIQLKFVGMYAESVFSIFNLFESLNVYCNIAIVQILSLPISFTTEKYISKLSTLYTVASNQVPQGATTGAGGKGVSGALFLKSSVPADDLKKLSSHWPLICLLLDKAQDFFSQTV